MKRTLTAAIALALMATTAGVMAQTATQPAEPIRIAWGEALRVTVSIGVAVAGTAGPGSFGIEGLVEQADLALLESKGAGRNQVTYRLSAA